MKKTLLLGLAILVSLGATACDKKAESNNTILEEQNENSIDYSKLDKESQMLYGKVKSIVGNEIEFELAKAPEGEIKGIEPEEPNEEETKGEMAAVEMTPSIEATEDYNVNAGDLDIEKNEPLVELDFTGEFKTINIPVGVNINVLTSKNLTGLDAIKEGTYLRLVVDDNKSENPTIIAVDVIS